MSWLTFWRRPGKNAAQTTPASASPLVRKSGRLVLRDAPYALPKDYDEEQRLDFQHYMLKYVLGNRNFLAPVRSPRAILDVGCGTGRWASEVARQFPDANVVGLDKIAPASDQAGNAEDRRPENYVFVQGDVLQGLSFADAAFDFVHMRLLYSAIPAAAWPNVLRELVRVTSHGGWVELVEAASVEQRVGAVEQINTWVIEACHLRGLDMAIAPHLGDLLRQAGIPQVTQGIYALPIGPAAGGRLGTMLEKDLVAIVKGARPLVVGAGLATADLYDQTVAQWQHDVTAYPMTFPFYQYYGQRP